MGGDPFKQKEMCENLEIISLHNNEPHEEVNLGKGKSLLGATKADYEVDEHITFKATNGNIDLMKVMCVLNSLGGEVLNNFLSFGYNKK